MDLARLHKPLEEELSEAMRRCIEKSDFILGASVQSFEANFARQLGANHAVGVASGTDALLLTLQAIGIGPGDEVICPAYGFVATAEVVLRLGAGVVFVDITPQYTIDPEMVKLAITERTKAILAVHLYGLTCDMQSLAQIATDYGIYLIEDVAQAAGARWGDRSLGAIGIAGCFSFYPTKNLGGMGDGGMVTTESDELADRLRVLRNHGRQDRDVHTAIGYNSRLDSIQAAMLDVKLTTLAEDNADRVANAEYYDANSSKDYFELPPLRTDGSHVYNLYTIRCPQRDHLKSFLMERQIETRVYYPTPIHLQPAFEILGYQAGHFPQSELAAQQVLSLPVYPGLTRQELEEVTHTLDLYVKTHPLQIASS
jgi:dTDP-4-amino-4,6-dideoxygalactose transaminase